MCSLLLNQMFSILALALLVLASFTSAISTFTATTLVPTNNQTVQSLTGTLATLGVSTDGDGMLVAYYLSFKHPGSVDQMLVCNTNRANPNMCTGSLVTRLGSDSVNYQP